MIVEFFMTILLYAGVALGGALLYFVGNLLFGFQRCGGKRLVIFVVGAISTTGGGALVVGMTKFDEPLGFGAVCLLVLAIVMGTFGLYALWMSFFAPPHKLNKLFDKLLDSI
jgi:ABC-type antimicrobial peptide transport system permease subunit